MLSILALGLGLSGCASEEPTKVKEVSVSPANKNASQTWALGLKEYLFHVNAFMDDQIARCGELRDEILYDNVAAAMERCSLTSYESSKLAADGLLADLLVNQAGVLAAMNEASTRLTVAKS